MHIHILGICGTFMGGIAVLAQQAGHTVTGCDSNVYPPMSTQLEAQGIRLTEGFDPRQIALNPDLYVIGNVVSRGNPLMEEILNRALPYISGPQWLLENILRDKWTLAVAGTHGKTTTASMLAWILEYGHLNPGFLIGGVPENFGLSARLSDTPFFVVEADEYDTAFFDKRSKFVHYRPRTLVINNMEFDHADIFPDLDAIETQFHHLVRTVPGDGLILANGQEDSVAGTLTRGCWSPVEWLSHLDGWQAGEADSQGSFDVFLKGERQGRVQWDLMGQHNRHNALGAIGAARHAGVPAALGIEALSQFKNVKRRMELRGVVKHITVYDDFAHHPTAIETTLAGLRAKVGSARILAVLEPRSNTMKQGTMKALLPGSLAAADHVFCYSANLGWDAATALAPLGVNAETNEDLNALIQSIAFQARPGDHVVIMSNGGFGGIHQKLLDRLAN